MKLLRFFPLLYVFLASWTDAFSVNQWIVLPIMAVIVSCVVYFTAILLFNDKIPTKGFNTEDSILVILYFALIFTTLFNSNAKTLNYLIVYFYVYFVMYIFMKYIFINFIPYKSILNVNLFTIFVVGCFGTVEFLLQILFDFDIQDHIPHRMYNDGMYMTGIPRTNGFSEEPTYLAWYMNTIGTIAIWWLFRLKIPMWCKILTLIPIIFCYITTFSGAGIPLLLVFSSLVFIILNKNRMKVIKGVAIVLVALLGFLQYINFDIITSLEPLIYKSTLQQEGEGHRPDLWQGAMNLLESSPFVGQGLGYYGTREGGSPINYYLTLSVEVGIIPLLILGLFYLLIFLKIVRYKGPERKVFLMGFFCCVAHLWTQSLFYHPCMWLFIIIVNKAQLEYNSISNLHYIKGS